MSARLLTVQAGKGGCGRLVPVDMELLGAVVAYLYVLYVRPQWSGPEL